MLAVALAVSLISGSIVTAEARDNDRHQRQHERHTDRHNYRIDEPDRQHARAHREQQRRAEVRAQRTVYERGYRQGRFDAGRYQRPAGYQHNVRHRGAHLPSAYYAPRYVVHNYGAFHLHRPPHGHHWVRVDSDVVLAAIATGAVVAVVNNLFY